MPLEPTWEDIALPILEHFAQQDQTHGRLRFRIAISDLADAIGKTEEQTESEVYRLRSAGYINFTSTIAGDVCYSCELLSKGARATGLWPSR